MFVLLKSEKGVYDVFFITRTMFFFKYKDPDSGFGILNMKTRIYIYMK